MAAASPLAAQDEQIKPPAFRGPYFMELNDAESRNKTDSLVGCKRTKLLICAMMDNERRPADAPSFGWRSSRAHELAARRAGLAIV